MLPRRALNKLSKLAVGFTLATFANVWPAGGNNDRRASRPQAFRSISPLLIKARPICTRGHLQTADEVKVKQLESAAGQGDLERVLPLPPNLGATTSPIPGQGHPAAAPSELPIGYARHWYDRRT